MSFNPRARHYTVKIQIEAVDGVEASYEQTDVNERDTAYLLANLPLAYSLPLSKQLRDKGLTPNPNGNPNE